MWRYICGNDNDFACFAFGIKILSNYLFFLNYLYAFIRIISRNAGFINFPNPTSINLVTSEVPEPPKPKGLKPNTVSDLQDCARAHSLIDSGKGKNITPFVSYAEVVNEKNGRKSTAGQVSLLLYDTIRACVTSNNKDNDS